jgi:hypothetical protein
MTVVQNTECLNLLKHGHIQTIILKKITTPGQGVLARDKAKEKTVHALSQNGTIFFYLRN